MDGYGIDFQNISMEAMKRMNEKKAQMGGKLS